MQPYLLSCLSVLDYIKANIKFLRNGKKFKRHLKHRQPDNLSNYLFIQHMGQALAVSYAGRKKVEV